METPGLLFQYLPLWAQIAIVIVSLLPALIQVVKALVRALFPRHPHPPRPRPFYRDLASQHPQVQRQQLRRKRNVTP